MPEPTNQNSERPPYQGRGGGSGPRSEGGPRGGGRGGDQGRPQRRMQRRFHRGKVCQFCVDKAIYVDYKDLERLTRFISPHGKILPRRMTGTCSRHMRMLTRAIKRARMMALLPYTLR